jgi:hypothetical protein
MGHGRGECQFVATLSRRRLTAALAARQHLIEPAPLAPADAIRELTPLQGQEPIAPYIGLAARVDGFTRDDLEAALNDAAVVKTTVMRRTLHLVAAADYPAFAQVARQSWLRAWRKAYAHLDEREVTEELTAWFAEPRSNGEIRERIKRFPGVPDDQWSSVLMARTLLPLIQLPPAGAWDDNRRALFVADPRPRPEPADAATLVLERYLRAFGPASKQDVASWAGATQRDFAPGFERLDLVVHHDESGRALYDLPDAPLPPEETPLPPRLLGHWDQVLLAYKQRERIMPPELAPLQLTISGDPTVTVDGRVAARWSVRAEPTAIELTIEPLTAIPRAARAAIRAEAEATGALWRRRVRVKWS